MMRAFAALFKMWLLEALQYRAAALSGIVTQFCWGVTLTVLYGAFYRYGSGGSSMSLSQTVTYVWLTECFLSFAMLNTEGEIMSSIRTGGVGVELCRPLGLYTFWYARTVASRLGRMALRCAGIIPLALLLPAGMRPSAPASLAAGLLFIPSIMAGMAVAASFSMFFTAVAMKVELGMGPVNMLCISAQILAGSYVPLAFFPESVSRVLRLLPFAAAADTPFSLYVGAIPPREAAGAIALQLAWAAGMITAGRLLLARRLKTVIIQGG